MSLLAGPFYTSTAIAEAIGAHHARTGGGTDTPYFRGLKRINADAEVKAYLGAFDREKARLAPKPS